MSSNSRINPFAKFQKKAPQLAPQQSNDQADTPAESEGAIENQENTENNKEIENNSTDNIEVKKEDDSSHQPPEPVSSGGKDKEDDDPLDQINGDNDDQSLDFGNEPSQQQEPPRSEKSIEKPDDQDKQEASNTPEASNDPGAPNDPVDDEAQKQEVNSQGEEKEMSKKEDNEDQNNIVNIVNSDDNMFNQIENSEEDNQNESPSNMNQSSAKLNPDESKDSIAEYERIISEKLEKKRKEELKKASDTMKNKLVKTGRCPVCTLSPPCNHYATLEEIVAANKKMNMSANKSKKSLNQSTHSQSAQKQDLPKPLRKKIIQHKARMNRSNRRNPKKSIDKGNDGFPAIHDEDFETSGNDKLNSTQITPLNNTDEDIDPNEKRLNHSLYGVPKRRMFRKKNYAQRLHSHNNRTKMRIQGKNAAQSEIRYVDIEKSLKKQKEHQERRRYILKARQRHKIQERIEKYREEKIQREIELLEEAKRLEAEEKHREEVREERRQKYLEKQRKKLEDYFQEKEKKEKEEEEKERKQENKRLMVEKRRKAHYSQQKRMIEEFSMKKKMTEDILKISKKPKNTSDNGGFLFSDSYMKKKVGKQPMNKHRKDKNHTDLGMKSGSEQEVFVKDNSDDNQDDISSPDPQQVK
ncbi:unnamed protein product [Moneuplotes crassus]|uniref:Uncharacterized protein n=1 Tax=Euplotes crassus TaxID=5936 RepID=A0AAD1YDB3_EUPCR|nr:unnamed protein product [Moneuplotes crassus]